MLESGFYLMLNLKQALAHGRRVGVKFYIYNDASASCAAASRKPRSWAATGSSPRASS